MKRRSAQLIGVIAAVLYFQQGSVSFRVGMLSTSRGQFLDGSGRMLQEVSWHMGNGLRTWGETYGLKFGRGYVTVQVTHIDPSWTKAEAREE
jgi:hypothetical protein